MKKLRSLLFTFHVSLFLSLVIIISGCTSEEVEETPEVPEDADIRPDVVFSIADDLPLNVYIESQGIVEANKELTIRPRVSGIVASTILEDGRYVQQGDTLLQFENQEFRYQLQQTQNEFDQVMAEYNMERPSRRENLTEAEERILRIYLGVEQAELNLQEAEFDFTHTVITAPFSGYLSVEERVSPGAYISGTDLGRLLEYQTVQIRMDVLESELDQLEPGLPARVTTPSGIQLEGVVRALSPVVNAESKTGNVLVEVQNEGLNLKPGMTVEGRIQVASHSGGVRIPREAVLVRDDGRTLTFKLNGSIVEWVYLEEDILYMTSEWALVDVEELAPGDTVAVDNHVMLSHLQPVRVRMEGQIVEEDTEVQ